MKRLLAWATIYSAFAAFQKLIGFAIFLWLARLLPVQEYARLGLLYALQSGIITFALAGVVEAVVGSLRAHPAEADREALYGASRRLLGWTTVAAVGLCALALSFGAGAAKVPFTAALWVLGSGVLLAWASYESQLVRLEERHLAAVLFNTLPPLAAFGGGFVWFLQARSVESFFAGSCIGAAIALTLLAGQRQHTRESSPATPTTRVLLATAVPFAAVAVLGWLSGYGQNYIVNGLFAPVEVARFTFALTFASVMQLVASGLNQVWSPKFYQLTHREPIDLVEKQNLRFFRFQAVSLGCLAGCIVALFPVVRRLVSGNALAYGNLRLELAALTAGYVLLPLWWHCQNYFLAYGKGPELMRNVATTSAVGLLVWVVLMWRLGPAGIYVGFFVQMMIRMLGAVVLARRHWRLTLAWDGVAVGLLLTAAGALVSTF